MRSRRALLYMPGDDRHKIEKAITLGVDCICMDMEDGVALSQKAEARRVAAASLRELDFGETEKLVRINPIGSGLEGDDLLALLPAHPDGVVVPKVERPDQLSWVAERIEAAELTYGWPIGSVRLMAIIETPRAFLHLKEMASHPRLEALIFGAEDLAAALGARRTPEAWEVFHSRCEVVLVSAAFGLQAIDMVSVHFGDLEALRAEARFGAQLGYMGKQIIHPNQVVTVQEAFTPSEAEIEAAHRLIEAFEAHQLEGRGAFALEGHMVDLPQVRAAQNVLARARAAGRE